MGFFRNDLSFQKAEAISFSRQRPPRGFRWACMPQKTPRTILAPEEPVSAGPTVKEHTSDSPTVDVGPAANLRAGLAAADFPGRPNKARGPARGGGGGGFWGGGWARPGFCAGGAGGGWGAAGGGAPPPPPRGGGGGGGGGQICGRVAQGVIPRDGLIRPAPGCCRARALLSLYVCHAAVIWQRQPSCCCGTGPGCPPPPAR